MIAWLISSSILSLLGAILYLTFRRGFSNPVHKKGLIWLILVVSLVLPPTFAHLSPFSFTHHEHPASVNTVQEYCHCQDPEASDKLMFEVVQTYDFILSHQTLLMGILLFFAGSVLLWLMVKVGFLVVKSRKNPQLKELDGFSYHEIPGTSKMPAGSFRLFRKYILWSKELNLLSEKEQTAIRWHEISHLRQVNTWENLALGLLQAIWFFNPAFYLFRSELKKLSEYIADDLAVEKTGDAKAYATLLVRMRSEGWQPGLSAFSNRELKNRVVRLVTEPTSQRRKTIPFWVAFLLMFPLTGFSTQYAIEEEISEIRTYAYMSAQNQEKGTEEFCRKCTYETVEQIDDFSLINP